VRLVLDTSVIVSAFRSRHGASRMLLDLLYSGKFEALASQALFHEYEDVLGRPEHKAVHHFTDERLDGIMRDLADRITPVEIYFRYRPQLRDPNDDLVLEAALNGGAEAIVTHNVRDFLPEATSHRLAVITPGSMIRERFQS
jgi:putative PIN family toxin of toxin-antitoxin system